jgi:urease accessory protein
MRKLSLIALLLIPALAQAHPGHGADSGFMAGAMHPLTGLDHLAGIVLAGALLGWLPERSRWFACAGFLALSGATHVLWTPAATDGGFIAGLLTITAGLVAAGMAATRLVRFTAGAARSRI